MLHQMLVSYKYTAFEDDEEPEVIENKDDDAEEKSKG